jgi:hypothetical protein
VAKQEQSKQLKEEKKQMEEAIRVITTIASKGAKEKYLKENFDKAFIDKLKEKVPTLLENNKSKAFLGAPSKDSVDNFDTMDSY